MNIGIHGEIFAKVLPQKDQDYLTTNFMDLWRNKKSYKFEAISKIQSACGKGICDEIILWGSNMSWNKINRKSPREIIAKHKAQKWLKNPKRKILQNLRSKRRERLYRNMICVLPPFFHMLY